MIPERLRIGDTIGIVSPSNPVPSERIPEFEKGVNFLENEGFKVKLAKNVFANSLGYSASPQEKASDIHELFKDKQVKAIICSKGGENCNAVLSLVDFEIIKKNPKIFLGISDPTILLNAFFAKTELVTFHGNDLMYGFGRNPTEYAVKEFKERLVEGKIGFVNKNSEWICIKEGKAEGILVGGNVNCLNKIIGTGFEPDFKGKVLFLESYGEGRPSTKLDAELQQLKQRGVFEKIKGLWLGYYKPADNFKIEEIAKRIVGEYDFPILKCDDFGHNTPNTTIPIGVKARIDANEKTVEILEKCVK